MALPKLTRAELRIVIALTVAVVWLAMSIGGLILRDYTALSVVTPVMVIVTGFLFARADD